MTSEMEQK